MFRFTIRDVLWLTVVVALAVGWRSHHRRQLGEWHSDHSQLEAAWRNDRNQLLGAIEHVRIILDRLSSCESHSEDVERILAHIKASVPTYSECPLPDSK